MTPWHTYHGTLTKWLKRTHVLTCGWHECSHHTGGETKPRVIWARSPVPPWLRVPTAPRMHALELLPEQAAGGRSRLSDSVRGERAPGDVTERAQRIGSWGETLTEMTDAPEGSRCANLWHSQEPFKHHWTAALEPQRLENGLVSRQCRVKAGGAGSRPLVTCSPEGLCCPEDQTSYIHCWFTNLKLFQQEASCRSI